MPKDLDLNTISVQDIIDAYNNHSCSEEEKDAILYFLSDLTGMSIDTLYTLMNEY